MNSRRSYFAAFTTRAQIIRLLSSGDGRDDAVSARDIADHVGESPSTVRDYIHDLRAEGWPIASKSGTGYWLIQDPEEFREVMAAWEREIESKRETMRSIAAAWYGEKQSPTFGGEA